MIRKKLYLLAITALAASSLLSSCGKKIYLQVLAPEESGLNMVKITDESKNTVLGSAVNGFWVDNPIKSMAGLNEEHKARWNTLNCLAISPDGTEIAYLTRVKGNQNIIVRSTSGSNASTQRTFRNVGDFSWGNDNNLYFVDMNETQNKISAIDGHAGTIMQQITTNNMDFDPILSPDRQKVFFTRYDKNTGPSIWSYNLNNGQLTSCAAGFQPAGINEDGTEFYCVRNSDKGNSEIWKVNYVNGRETVILSDKDRGYTHPTISPDGQWMLVVGNSESSINKQKNLDIFAVRTDGRKFVQLTYHPGNDCCPQWSKDGKSIYFISDRANKDKAFNVWRMNFDLVDPTYAYPASHQEINNTTERTFNDGFIPLKENSAKPTKSIRKR